MAVLYTNNATTTLSASITSVDTTLTVAATTGALFPSPTGSDFFYITLIDASNNIEIVKCTARSTDTLTIVRGQEGTTANAYSAGAKVELRVTAAGLANKLDKDTGGTLAGKLTTLASSSSKAGVNVPHGSAPTSPVNGDIWTTTAGLYVRVNGITVGPLAQAGAALPGTVTFNNSGTGASSVASYSGTTNVTISYNTLGAAPLASPALTGTPTAPTAGVGTSTTQIATTAFVQAAKAASVQSVTSAGTVTPTFTNDQVSITAQAASLTLANPSGTASDGWGIVIRVKDNGTPRTISYGTQYRAVGVTLPTTTVASKTLYLGGVWNAADSKLDIVAVAQE